MTTVLTRRQQQQRTTAENNRRRERSRGDEGTKQDEQSNVTNPLQVSETHPEEGGFSLAVTQTMPKIVEPMSLDRKIERKLEQQTGHVNLEVSILEMRLGSSKPCGGNKRSQTDQGDQASSCIRLLVVM